MGPLPRPWSLTKEPPTLVFRRSTSTWARADTFTVNNTTNTNPAILADETFVYVDGGGNTDQFFVNNLSSPVSFDQDEPQSETNGDTLTVVVPTSGRSACATNLFNNLTYTIGNLVVDDRSGSSADQWAVANNTSNNPVVNLTDGTNTNLQVLAALDTQHTVRILGATTTSSGLTVSDPNSTLTASAVNNAVQVSQGYAVLQHSSYAAANSTISVTYHLPGDSSVTNAVSAIVSPDGQYVYVLPRTGAISTVSLSTR